MRHGLEVVSLPDVFASRERTLPGRELFYDYCHLTPEGIDLAMTAVARKILGAQPPAVTSEPDSDVLARAAIGAAVHGVHRGARGEIVRYWLKKACAFDESARETLASIVNVRASRVPAVLTPEQLLEPRLTPQHGWQWDGLDAETLAAIGDQQGQQVLEKSLLRGPGESGRVELWSRLDRVYTEAMGAVDLPTEGVFRALWPATDYALVLPAGGSVEIVLRSSGGRAYVALDGRRLATLNVSTEWRRVAIDILPGRALRRLTLSWRRPDSDGDLALASAVRRLDKGLDALLHPVFGEVFSIRVV